MSWLTDLATILPVGLAVVGLAFWLGQLDRRVDDHDKRLANAAPQTDVDDLDGRVTAVERSIAEIHAVKEEQARQGAKLDSIHGSVERLVRLHDRERV
jgi:hypothetical protein